MIDAKSVGERIANLRKGRKLTQTALAEKLSVSPKTVSKWEKGHGLPDVEILPDLAGFFNTTIDSILMGKHVTVKDLNFCTQFSINGGQKQWVFPSITDFPEEIRDALLDHFLCEYAIRNNIDYSKFYLGLSSLRKTDKKEEVVENLLELDQVSISKIQKKIYIGFSKAAQILDTLEEKALIERKGQYTFEWVNKDKAAVLEIINKVY